MFFKVKADFCSEVVVYTKTHASQGIDGIIVIEL
jgi:hypothetical protein